MTEFDISERRTSALTEVAAKSGEDFGYLESITRGLDAQAFEIVLSNILNRPTYMKSSEKP